MSVRPSATSTHPPCRPAGPNRLSAVLACGVRVRGPKPPSTGPKREREVDADLAGREPIRPKAKPDPSELVVVATPTEDEDEDSEDARSDCDPEDLVDIATIDWETFTTTPGYEPDFCVVRTPPNLLAGDEPTTVYFQGTHVAKENAFYIESDGCYQQRDERNPSYSPGSGVIPKNVVTAYPQDCVKIIVYHDREYIKLDSLYFYGYTAVTHYGPNVEGKSPTDVVFDLLLALAAALNYRITLQDAAILPPEKVTRSTLYDASLRETPSLSTYLMIQRGYGYYQKRGYLAVSLFDKMDGGDLGFALALANLDLRWVHFIVTLPIITLSRLDEIVTAAPATGAPTILQPGVPLQQRLATYGHANFYDNNHHRSWAGALAFRAKLLLGSMVSAHGTAVVQQLTHPYTGVRQVWYKFSMQDLVNLATVNGSDFQRMAVNHRKTLTQGLYQLGVALFRPLEPEVGSLDNDVVVGDDDDDDEGDDEGADEVYKAYVYAYELNNQPLQGDDSTGAALANALAAVRVTDTAALDSSHTVPDHYLVKRTWVSGNVKKHLAITETSAEQTARIRAGIPPQFSIADVAIDLVFTESNARA